MKEVWLQKKECTGCGACENICPHNAIQLKPDQCGFIYPEITDQCVDCNLCEKVCAQRKNKILNYNTPVTYAVWSKDEQTRYCSTSGGAFSELARTVLLNGGKVVGAQYNEKNLVEHVVITSEDGLKKIRQSKYIQSEIKLVYREVKSMLKGGIEVLFCGAPCQVAGLYAFLGKEYEHLITADFICRGMNSPKAYMSWLDEIEKEHHSHVKQVWFKYKIGGWKKSPRCTRIDFENGEEVVYDQEKNLFMKGYLETNLYIRPSCGDCQFKGIPRQGDITLADFWGLAENLDDDKGVSMVLLNNKKGEYMFGRVKDRLEIHQRNFEEIFEGNVCFANSVNINPKSEKFLCSLDRYTFSKALTKYTKPSVLTAWKKKIKSVGKKIYK